LEKPRNQMGQDLNWIELNPTRTFSPQSRSNPMWFLVFSNHEKGAPRQEILKWSTVCSMFLRSGWSIVRSASLAKGGTSKKRLSLHLHNVLTQSNRVSPWTLQTALIKRLWQATGWMILFSAVN
jgi:hypothetical protein